MKQSGIGSILLPNISYQSNGRWSRIAKGAVSKICQQHFPISEIKDDEGIYTGCEDDDLRNTAI